MGLWGRGRRCGEPGEPPLAGLCGPRWAGAGGQGARDKRCLQHTGPVPFSRSLGAWLSSEAGRGHDGLIKPAGRQCPGGGRRSWNVRGA